MTVLGEKPTIRDRLNMALIEWQFVRISNEQLREVLNEFLDEHADADQMKILSDPRIDDEIFLRVALELFQNRRGKRLSSSGDSLGHLPPIPDPFLDANKAGSEPNSQETAVVTSENAKHEGIDWVSLFYSTDDYIGGKSGGWLSIPRLIGLTCVVAILSSPFYLLEETPVQWKQFIESQWPKQRSVSRDSHDSVGSFPTADRANSLSDDSSSDAAEESSTRIDIPGPNVESEGFTDDVSLDMPVSSESPSRSLDGNRAAASTDEHTDASDSTLAAEKFRSVIQLIDEGSHESAREVLMQGIANREIRAGNPSMLLEVEITMRDDGPDARKRAWQKMMKLDANQLPELCQLFVARWMLDSTVSERTQILLGEMAGNNSLAKRAVVWAEARGGSTDPETVSNLNDYIKNESFSLCDSLFLANLYSARKEDDAAYDILFNVREELKDLRRSDESFVSQWLLETVINSIEERIDH